MRRSKVRIKRLRPKSSVKCWACQVYLTFMHDSFSSVRHKSTLTPKSGGQGSLRYGYNIFRSHPSSHGGLAPYTQYSNGLKDYLKKYSSTDHREPRGYGESPREKNPRLYQLFASHAARDSWIRETWSQTRRRCFRSAKEKQTIKTKTLVLVCIELTRFVDEPFPKWRIKLCSSHFAKAWSPDLPQWLWKLLGWLLWILLRSDSNRIIDRCK